MNDNDTTGQDPRRYFDKTNFLTITKTLAEKNIIIQGPPGVGDFIVKIAQYFTSEDKIQSLCFMKIILMKNL